MQSLEVDSIVESVLSPGDACGDLPYIYSGKQCENEVHTVNRHKTIEVLYYIILYLYETAILRLAMSTCRFHSC